MRPLRTLLVTLASCSALSTAGVQADTLPTELLMLEDSVSLSEIATIQSAIPLSELEGIRGRQDLIMNIDEIQMIGQRNEGEQSALLNNNVLSGGGITGNNLIDGNAFSAMSGIATVIQNTGNQVIIQDTTMINIMFRQ
jgi:hypothetical protein